MTHAMRILKRSRRARLVAASSAAVIVWSLASAAQAQDLPTNPVIVDSNGVGTAATFTFGSNTLTVDQNHDRVVIDWDDFNIGAADTVTFNQPDAGAIAFNRVDPTTFTTIDGTLNANGGVWLFSPGGLLFGSGAVVNVGSFVGTTARLADVDIADALATNAVTLSPIPIPNGADLTVSAGAEITGTSGFVVLVGETIVQDGVIVSDNDAVWFGVAQGGEITFTSPGAGQAPDLADGTVAAAAGQQPSFTQGNTGATTAATWVGVSNPSTTANGWSTLINLGGTIEASGVKPTTDSGVWIITGDDGVYDLTTAGTFIDSTGGLITANNGDVYIRSGGAVTLQDVYAEDIDVFTGEDLTLTGAIQATSDIIIGSDTLVTIESTADLHASLDVVITTTDTGADIVVDGTIYAYQYATLVADDLLQVNGSVEGVYGVDLWGIDVTTGASSSVISLNNVYIHAEDAIDLSGDITGYNVTAVSDNDINQNGGTITVDSGGLYFYAYNDITTAYGALIEAGPDADHATIYLNAGHDLYLAGDIMGDYFVTINSVGIGNDTTLEVSGTIYASDFILLYNDYGDIHLTGTAELYTGVPIEWAYPSIYIGAEGSIITDAGSVIRTTGGYVGEYVGIYSNDVTGSIDLSGDITSENVIIEAPFGVVDIYLRDGTITSQSDFVIDSNGVFLLGGTLFADNVTIDAVGDLSVTGVLDANGSVALTSSSGDVYAPGALYAETFIDIEGDAVTLGHVSGDNLAIDVLADSGITLNDELWSTPYSDITLETTGAGSQIDIGAQVYASTITVVSAGGVTVEATADIDVTNYVNTLPGEISASITAYGDLTIVAGASIDAQENIRFETTGPGSLLTVDGFVRGVDMDFIGSGGVDIGGSINAYGDLYVDAVGDVDLGGDIYAPSMSVVSDANITQSAGTITVETRFDAYADGEFNTSAGALITSAVGYDAIVDVIANGDISLAGDVTAYDVIFAGHGDMIEVSGLLSGSERVSIYNDSGDIHLTSTAEIYAGPPVNEAYPVVYIGASGSIVTDAGSYIHTAPGYSGAYVNMHSNGPTGSFDLSGDITSANIYLGSRNGDVDVILRDGDLVATESVFVVSSGDLTTGANTTITTDGNVYLEADANIDLSGDISGHYVSVVADGNIHQLGGTITVEDGGFYSYSAYDTTTDAGAVITNAVGSDNAVIEIFAGYSLDLGGAIYGYEVFLDSVGPMILISGSIYASDFIFVYNDTGSLHLTGTADLETGTPVASSFSSIYLGAYGSVRVDDGAQITAGVGQTGSYVSLFANGPTGYLDMSGDIASGGIYMGARSGDVDVTVDGALYADGDLFVTATGDLTTGADSVIQAGGDIYIDADGAIDLSGDIYGYSAEIISDTDVTQSAGTITVDDGGLYIYALYDVTTEAGARIETSPDGGMGIIYLNAGDDLTVGGDIHGGYFVNLNSEANDLDSTVTISGSIYSTDFIIVYNQYGDIHLTGTADLYAGAPINFSEPGIWIAAEGSILTDAGSTIGTRPGYADGYVHIESNATDGSIDLSSDITSENVTIEAPFGVVDIYLRGGTIQTANDFYIDSNGLLLVGGAIYADYVTLESVGDMTISGDILAADAVSLTSTGGDVYISGFVEGFAYAGTAILVSAEGDLTIAAGGDLEGYGDVVLQTTGNAGVLEVSGDVLGYNVYLDAEGGILVGSTADIYAYETLQLLSDDGTGGATVADIQIDGWMDGNGVSIINRNDGDIILGATAHVASYYYICGSCRTEPGGETGLQGQDGDIYIYSTGAVVTAAGSVIDASLGYGADAGLLTIIANGTDGATAAIDLAGDIIADDTVLTASAGSIAIRGTGAVEYGNFTADAAQDFILESGASIEGFAASDVIDITAGDDITLDGLVDAARVYVTATGSANDPGGAVIDIGGTVVADYYVGIENQAGDIFIRDGAYVGGAYYSGYTVVIDAYGDLTTEAGSYIYGGYVRLLATAQYADLTTAGDIYGYQVYLFADTDMDIGGSIGGEFIDIVAQGGDSAAGDITISAEVTAVSGISIRNYNDGTVTFTADAAITLPDGGYYCYTCLQGNDGDIYIYSAGSVVTVAGSLIDATGGVGADAGLVTIVANGTDGATSAIDLSGDIVSYVTDLQADFGSIRQRDGTIYHTDGFTADAAFDFIQDGAGVIDGVNGVDDGNVDITADGDITIDGVIEGYYVDITTSGLVTGSDIQIDGEVYATDGIEITNQNGDILVGSTGRIHTGSPYEASTPDIYLTAWGLISTEAGSDIYSDASYLADVALISYATSGNGIELAGDISAADDVYIRTAGNADIEITEGEINADNYLFVYSEDEIRVTGGLMTATDVVQIQADSNILLAGDIYSGLGVTASIYDGEQGGTPVLRVEGDITARGGIRLNNELGAIEIGSTAVLTANYSGNIYAYSTLQIWGETITSEAGSLMQAQGGNAEIYAYAPTGVGVALYGDVDVGLLLLNSYGDADVIIGGVIEASDDIQINSAGALTTLAGSQLNAGDLVRVRSDRDMLLSGDVDAGNYFIASIYGGESGGIDEAYIRVEGDIDAGNTIRIYNDVGDVEIGAGAQLHANLDGAAYQYYQTYEVEIFGENILTEAGSLITTGAAAGPRVGSILIESVDYSGGAATLVDLSGDIDTDLLQFDIDYGSMRVREGDIDAIAGLVITVDGYFVVDEPANIYTQGDFFGLSYAGMTINGDITADDMLLQDFSATDLVIGGTLTANERITIRGQDDLRIDGGVLIADADDYTSPSQFTGAIYLEAEGQVTSTAGSSLRVGPAGAPTGDIFIEAGGYDDGGFSSIDLSSDIDAQYLVLDAGQSIRLRDGDIFVTEDLDIASVADFVMDDPATITALEDVAISAANNLVAAGDIVADGDISLLIYSYLGQGYFTAGPGDMVVSGDVTANGSVTLTSGEGGDDIYLDPTANILANADDAGIGDDVYISAYGQVISAAGSAIRVGTTPTPSGEVTILAAGGDNLNYSAIDLSGDIDALTLVLQTANGSIHLADGTINVVNDLTLNSNFDIAMDAPAQIFGDGNVDFIADRSLVMDGLIDADGSVSLLVTTGGQDLEVGGTILAGQAVDIHNQAGDILIDGADIVSDADAQGADGGVVVQADGQVVVTAGSSILVGATGAPTGDVFIEAQGADGVNDASVDLAGDIEAVNVTIDSDGGSVHLAGGAIDISGDLEVESVQDIIQDQAATIDAGGDVYFDAEEVLTVEGSIQAGGRVDLLVDGPNAGVLTVNDLVTAGGVIYVVNTNGDIVLGSETSMFAGGDILLDAHGDLSTQGFIDAAGALTAHGDAVTIQSDIQAGAGAVFAANGDLVLDAQIIAEGYSVIHANAGDTLQQTGQLSAGGNIRLYSYGDMTIDGSVGALGDVHLLVYGGEGAGDIVIGGDIVSHDDVRIYNNANYGDIEVLGTGSITADIDGDGGAGAELLIYSDGRVIGHTGSTLQVGSNSLRTGLISIYAYGYDGEGAAAVALDSHVSAESVVIEAYNGSVHLYGDAVIAADEYIQISAYEDFISDEGSLVWGAQERQFQDDLSTETTLPGVQPGVLISASDVDISGDVRSGDADDDATIVIAALDVDGDVTIGGADNGLGTGFTLSDAEFDNLVADRIVLLAGTGSGAPDLHVHDLSIDAANTSDVWLGTTGTVFVEGDVTPSQAGEVDLHIGFTVLTQSNVIDFTALDPGYTLVDFIPGDIYITGNLGDATNPFGHVTLVARGDIFMGSEAFIEGAEDDPEFDAFEQSENFDSPGEGHIFIAADALQMAATGRILQQDTVEGPGFGGLALGQPVQGQELIFSPDDIEGEPIGFGTDQWTANFDAGPTRIELFGFFHGTPHAITGLQAAGVDHLLDPDILLGDYFLNTCLFGSQQCSAGNDLPPFQNPTPPVHPDPDVTPIPGVEEAVSFFSSFPFQEPDEEEEEEQIEGEPVTGSGNEDLWPVKTLGGTRP